MKIYEPDPKQQNNFRPFVLCIAVETEADFHNLKAVAHDAAAAADAVLDKDTGYTNKDRASRSGIIAALESLRDALKLTTDRGLTP